MKREADMGLVLDMRFPPQWARIDRVSCAVGDCVAAVFAELDVREALRMTCSELLENAIKYGRDGASIRLSVFDGDDDIVIEVSNRVDGRASIDAVQGRIAWIDEHKSAEQAYAAALLEVAQRPDEEQGDGGLGLVRIAYEGGCRLTADSTEDDLLTIRASHPVSLRQSRPSIAPRA